MSGAVLKMAASGVTILCGILILALAAAQYADVCDALIPSKNAFIGSSWAFGIVSALFGIVAAALGFVSKNASPIAPLFGGLSLFGLLNYLAYVAAQIQIATSVGDSDPGKFAVSIVAFGYIGAMCLSILTFYGIQETTGDE